MRVKFLAVIAGAVLLGGCYHITVETGSAPSTTVVDRPWQHSFINGLVPPAELDVKDKCSSGVSKVETLASPANVLVWVLQGVLIGVQIYSPVSAKVTCAR